MQIVDLDLKFKTNQIKTKVVMGNPVRALPYLAGNVIDWLCLAGGFRFWLYGTSFENELRKER